MPQTSLIPQDTFMSKNQPKLELLEFGVLVQFPKNREKTRAFTVMTVKATSFAFWHNAIVNFRLEVMLRLTSERLRNCV